MHKRIKHLIKNMKDVFNIDEINEIAKDTKFVQRKSNITAKDFLTLNIFHGEAICSAPLSQLASKYDALFDTQISKQALDKRFNKYSVEFMKGVFNKMMHIQNTATIWTSNRFVYESWYIFGYKKWFANVVAQNDAEYLNIMKKDKERKDLKLADLGYFKVDYLRKIATSGSSFISKVKSNTSLYIKNPNPERIKLGL